MLVNAAGDEYAQFNSFVPRLQSSIKRQYDRSINKDLSQQNWRNLFKRNVTVTLRWSYDDTLVHLKKDFDADSEQLFDSQESVSNQLLKAFDGYIDEFFAIYLK